MYSEWASLSPLIAANSNGSSSTVLNKFSAIAGREVSQAVVKQLAANLGITQSPEPSILVTDDEVSQYGDETLSFSWQKHQTEFKYEQMSFNEINLFFLDCRSIGV